MKLFEPVSLKKITLKNRIAMPAIHHCYTPEGYVNDRLISYYAERARGGTAMITVGGCTIDHVGQGPMMIGIHDDKFLEGLEKLASSIKDNGAVSAAQLYQAGRYTHSIMSGQEPIAPSALASRLTREKPREMTIEDIEQVKEAFSEAALRAQKAGFDAVEILGSAGYLICQFLSPLTNQRTDQYGGSLENRMRFGLEVVEKCRVSLGPDYPLIIRLSGNDFMPDGNTIKETVAFARALQLSGIDCFNITGGWHESRVPQITGDLPRGGFAYLAQKVKEVVNVPVMASNRINDPLVAENILQQNLADIVNMGRALIADPNLPSKSREGRYHAIRHCIACNQGCLDMVFTFQDVHCTVNARAGKERDSTISPAKKAKKILVIGGGPAGMETARIAAKRGHEVTLWEKGNRLGGNLYYASIPPGKEEFSTLISYYEYALATAGVHVSLNHEATAEEIVSENADTVVIATGAIPSEAPFEIKEDIELYNAKNILDGSSIPGDKVVIIGGGSVGCETALTVAQMGTISAEMTKFLIEHDGETVERIKELITRGSREVTLVELEKGIGRDMGVSTRWITVGCIRKAGIRVLDKHQVIEVNSSGVLVENSSGKTLIEADTVVLATGSNADDTLAKELKNRLADVHITGDAKKPAKITEAIREGFDLGCSL